MKTLPVLLAVYSVREEAAADFRATMTKVKELGYDGVELAGLYGLDAADIRAVLDDLELPAVSAHIPFADMVADIDTVIANAQTLGLSYAAIPYLPAEERPGSDGFQAVLDAIPDISARFREAGIQLLYHNHDFEFIPMPDGRTGLDTIYDTFTPEQLAAEPDTCWVRVAGYDPAEWIDRYAGRVPVVHLKDFVMTGRPANLYQLIGTDVEEEEEGEGSFDFRPLGEGRQDFPAILAAALRAGAEYVVVEQDRSSDRSPFEAAAASRRYLATLGW